MFWKSFFLVIGLFYCLACFTQPLVNSADSNVVYSTASDAPVIDSVTLFTIKDIEIEGNSKTREAIILRELSFTENEQLPLNVLVEKFAEAKKQLMNLALFRNVVVSLKSITGNDAIVNISVLERWYIYPMPFLKIVERSFGEWVDKMDMDRVNYGIRLTHTNTTGRNDKFYLKLMNGYTREVSFSYNNIYLDKALKWSSGISAGYGQNREVNYSTKDNRQMFLKKNNEYIHSFFFTNLSFDYRPAIKTKHNFSFGYNRESLSDSVFALNPDFSFQKIIEIPHLSYGFSFQDVDFLPYPTQGQTIYAGFLKKGFVSDINLWQFTLKTQNVFTLSDKYFLNLQMAGMLKLPFRQPFITRRLIGYDGFYIQGYDRYVIDGVGGGFARTTLTRKLVNTSFNLSSNRIKQLNYIPLKVYAKVFANAGYVHDVEANPNTLANTFLYAGGAGIDVVLFYNLIFRFQWGINHLGQNSLYLHQ
jgi:outer membrane protein assembly factor BamA